MSRSALEVLAIQMGVQGRGLTHLVMALSTYGH